MLIIAATGSSASDSAWVGALIAVIIAGMRFSWLMTVPDRRLFEMVTWLFVYVFLGIAPLVQLRGYGAPSTTPNVDFSNAWTAIAAVIVFEVLLILGAVLAPSRIELPAARPRTIDPVRVYLWTALLLSMGAAYIALIGLGAIWGPRVWRGAVVWRTFGDPLVAQIVEALVSVGLLTVIVAQVLVMRDGSAAWRSTRRVVVFFSALMLLTIVNPVGSPRYVFGVIVLGLLAVMGAYSSLLKYRATSILALLSLAFLFPVLDSFRYSTASAIEFSDPLPQFASPDFDAFAQLINVVEYVNDVGPTLGWQMVGVLLFWVPRAFWPSKPVDTGVLIANYKGYAFSNLSAPLPAELLINGAFLAVIVGAVALGVFLRRWDTSNELQLKKTGVPTLLGCVLPFYLLLVLRGSLLQAMASLSVILAVSALVTSRSDRRT
ncbi:hypothetical protein GCM10023065_06360 [Microbacterium laevaniformans]|uniref:hypothetical protein n=1 Tax=Microbacterium laevaniformans TaxID=36807 RepID=UPI00195EE448|nr:hypothetical protein [Microbacterium laevaniformans]MBM7751591.1 hypothetical protein [Microbacterium laevaniformans]GLJ63750.1 hypothetical protein GCM10017578_06370 [Microbacterium laevaniformans]